MGKGGAWSKRPRQKNGIYRSCRLGLLGWRKCPGYRLSKGGHVVPHQRCGGDGLIKIGERSTGGRPSGPRPRRPKRPKGTGRTRRRVSGTLGVAVAAWGPAGHYLGTIGQLLVAVVVVTLVVLKVAAWILGGVAMATTDRRTASA
jgi:hypothetical protein